MVSYRTWDKQLEEDRKMLNGREIGPATSQTPKQRLCFIQHVALTWVDVLSLSLSLSLATVGAVNSDNQRSAFVRNCFYQKVHQNSAPKYQK